MKNLRTLFTIFLTALTVACLAACASKNPTDSMTSTRKTPDPVTQSTAKVPVNDPVDGGWEYNQGELSLDRNPEAKAAFEKALEGLVGCAYEPVALIGSQVVAGTNYVILCRTTPVVPDAETVFSLVTVYEDLNGNAELKDVTDLNI